MTKELTPCKGLAYCKSSHPTNCEVHGCARIKPVPSNKMAVRFVGVNPLALTDGASLPMVRDSWRFAFWEQDGQLCFGQRDDGPLVAFDAVDEEAPTETLRMMRRAAEALEGSRRGITGVDCGTCANRGRVDGLSQETHCEHCCWSDSWRRDHYKAAIANQEARDGR